MNKNNTLWLIILLTSFLLAGSVMAKAADSKIDVCKLTNPPSDAYRQETHAALLLSYPEKIPKNYTGCHATWLAESAIINGVDQIMKSHLLLMLKLNAGEISRVELHEPDEDTVVCEFNQNHELTKGSEEACMPYSNWQLNDALIDQQ